MTGSSGGISGAGRRRIEQVGHGDLQGLGCSCSSQTRSPSPSGSWLQDVGPVAEARRWRHPLEDEPLWAVGGPGFPPRAPPFEIIILGEDERGDTRGDINTVEARCAKGRPAGNAVDLAEGSRRLEPFAKGECLANAHPLPRRAARRSQGDLVEIAPGLKVEENTLDRSKYAPFPRRDQEGREKTGQGLWTPRAARMKAQVVECAGDTAKAQIGLRRRTLDRESIVPQSLEICGASSALGGRWLVATTRFDAGDLAQDVVCRAAGKAMDQDAVMPLPQRQAGFGICVRRAPAHGVEAVPCAAKGADDIDEGLGGFKGNEGHHISFLVCSTPLPFSDRPISGPS